ncbi:MAG: transcriptional regulator [Firmicutes bacterium]|nr:transcriptional regulator [Bacillota bacterium]
MIQLQQLIIFEKVAETSSMNKAAEALFMSQPNLSKAIRNLEKELGIRIFDRTNKGVKLTEDGYRLYKYVKTMHRQLDMIQGISREEAPDNISVSAYPCPVLYRVLGEFYKNNREKHIEVTLKEERVQSIIDSVANLQSDIGIIEVNDVQDKEVARLLKARNMEYNELARDTWYVHVGKNSPLYDNEVIKMEQLVECTVMRAPDDYFSNLSYLFEVDGVHFTQFEKTMFVSDYFTRIRLLNTTDMVCIETTWNEEFEKEIGIRSIPIANCDIQVGMGWIKRKNETLPAKLLEFIEILKRQL